MRILKHRRRFTLLPGQFKYTTNPPIVSHSNVHAFSYSLQLLDVMSFRSSLFLASFLLFRSLLAWNCYRPSGELITDPNYVPCNPTAAEQTGGASMCCNVNRATFPDTCLSNGLCQNGGDTFRDSCTDPTWQSPGCVKLCTTGYGQQWLDVGMKTVTDMNYTTHDVAITQCAGEKYCCGYQNSTCCQRGDGISIPDVSNATSSSNTTNTSSTSHSDGGLSTKAAIGVAVACSVVGSLVVGLLLWYLLRRRRSQSDSRQKPNDMREKVIMTAISNLIRLHTDNVHS